MAVMVRVMYFMVFLICMTIASTQKNDTILPLPVVVEQLLADKEYRSDLRPNAMEGIPVHVMVDVHADHMSSIDEVNNEFTLTVFLRQTWMDPRLAYRDLGYEETLDLHHTAYNRIWFPELYVKNVKHGEFHTITVPNRFIRLFPNGTIMYSQRLTITVFCNLKLRKYPMDEQKCHLQFENYGQTNKDVVLSWHPYANFSASEDISSPGFIFHGVEVVPDCQALYRTGNFSCLLVVFHMTRRLTMYILSVYVPSILVVILSWISFWIDMESVPARISLGVITLLTVTTQTFSNSHGLFNTSVLKALDVWMAVCLLFVFAAFLEYAVVNTLGRRQKARRPPGLQQALAASSGVTTLPLGEKANLNGTPVRGVRFRAMTPEVRSTADGKGGDASSDVRGSDLTWTAGSRDKALRIDIVSRILFPVSFGIFNLLYWPIFLNMEP